jgi:hypothetical protein
MRASSEPVAGVGVGDGQNKQAKREGQQNDVEHGRPLSQEASNDDRTMFLAIKMRYEFACGGINEK